MDAYTQDKYTAKEVFTFDFVKTDFKGIAQVMFQNNALTGLLFLAGIIWGSFEEGQPHVGWGCIGGVAVSTLTGVLLGLPKKDGEIGLWGFNGALVGCGIFTFLGSNFYSWAALILCAAVSTWVRVGFNNLLAPYKINSLTFPFVFSTWIFLLAARAMKELDVEHLATPLLPGYFDFDVNMSFGSLVIYWLKGIGQVFLVNSWITGIFFIVALFVSNRYSAMWAMIASALSLLIAIIFRAVGLDIENGLFGFSPVLTGIALGSTFYTTNLKSSIWCVVGIVITVFVQAAMDILFTPFGLPTLTAPFCIATWLFLLPLFKWNKEKSEKEKADKEKEDN